MTRSARSRRGFSLIELLVVIGVISLLLAILIPAVRKSRHAALRTECSNKARQLGLAMQNYHSTHGLFPPGGVHRTTVEPGKVPRGEVVADARAPWTVLILPYLDESHRYDAFDMDAPFAPRQDWIDQVPEPNKTQQDQPLLKFYCPGNPNTEWAGLFSCYAACQGGGAPDEAAETTVNRVPRLFFDNGVFQCNSSVKLEDLKDGASNTVLIGETKYIGTPASFEATNAWWGWAAAIRAGDGDESVVSASLFNISATCDPINFPQEGLYTELQIRHNLAVTQGGDHGQQQRVYGSWHSGGAHFVMGDGAVHFLNENMDVEVYRSLGKRADGTTARF